LFVTRNVEKSQTIFVSISEQKPVSSEALASRAAREGKSMRRQPDGDAGRRGRRAVEILAEIDRAQALAWDLATGCRHDVEEEAGRLYGRLEAIRAEVDAMRFGRFAGDQRPILWCLDEAVAPAGFGTSATPDIGFVRTDELPGCGGGALARPLPGALAPALREPSGQD
jgi:hypothetical protein